jgi:beta-lactamase regulating signal transducer with metallopeptidase domain
MPRRHIDADEEHKCDENAANNHQRAPHRKLYTRSCCERMLAQQREAASHGRLLRATAAAQENGVARRLV